MEILSLSLGSVSLPTMILCILSTIGKYEPIEKQFPKTAQHLIPICEKIKKEGNQREAKHAVRCLYFNIVLVNKIEPVLSTVFKSLQTSLIQPSPHFRCSISTIGELFYFFPNSMKSNEKKKT